jgi:hypothetical protein
VLTGARFGDYSLLIHASGKKNLTDCIIDLVGARMAQVFPLKIDPRAVLFGETFRKVQRSGAADEVLQMMLNFSLEIFIAAGCLVLCCELV